MPKPRERSQSTAAPSGAVDHAVNHVLVEIRRSFTQSHDSKAHGPELPTTGKKVVVAFIHVVLVQQKVVNGWRHSRDGLRIAAVGMAIELPRQSPAAEG